jgi:hypothetical protein
VSTKKFAIKTTINAVALIVLTILMCVVFANTVITNDIALGQMNNSNEAYLLMAYYNHVRTTMSIVYSCLSAFIVGSVIYDIYKFTKNKGEI